VAMPITASALRANISADASILDHCDEAFWE
jgi:hypothetical protein